MSVIVEERNKGLWITLARPAQRNAITGSMFDELTRAFECAAATPALKYVIVQGLGNDFCAGGDLGEFDTILNVDRAERPRAVLGQFRSLTVPWFVAMQAVPQPIIASARGHAIAAGAQLLFASDLVIASPTLQLSVIQAKLAHTMDHGESFSLPRKVGLAKAMEMALLGDPLDATGAQQAGLVNWVVIDERLEAETKVLAGRLARGASVALREMKGLLTAAARDDSRLCLEREAAALARCAASKDFVEALDAFASRRRPVFQS
jgi:2-(1,2-epoxy-1,2-dihydrophenyl)acetyl-CoA isomerase